jgi:two-component system CheB/CheR fusion protein
VAKQIVPNKKKITAAQQSITGKAILRGVRPFPIVGIGASAGGIEAVSELLGYLPSDLGMAYVVVQHLAPKHTSILPELLQKKTEMKVHTVVDGMALVANNVFVIPPNTYISITDGHLTLSKIESPGRNQVIDHFLTALAATYQNNAVGIVLSGMASDGTAGIEAI